jgi:hypothetical protein
MYTVFDGAMKPKFNRIGLVVFVRSLSEAREHCTEVGDRIVGWSSSGSPRTTWERQLNGRITVVPKAR